MRIGACWPSRAALGGLPGDFGWHLGLLGHAELNFWYPLGSLWAARGVFWISFGELRGGFWLMTCNVFPNDVVDHMFDHFGKVL